MEKKQVKRQNIIQLVLLLALVGLLNFISHNIFHRFDLTQEKRFTLSPSTKTFLKDMEDVVFLKVYLEGDNMPAGFQRLQKSTKELLDEFRRYSGNNLQYEFINPSESPDKKTRTEIYDQLAKDGLMYFNVTSQASDGSEVSLPVFPAAMVSYSAHGQQLDRPVNFFRGSSSNRINDGTINRAVENLEYEFISAMRVITRQMVPRVAIIEGHGELDKNEIGSLSNALTGFYRVDRVTIDQKLNALDDFDAIIVADPKERINERDQYIIDQFIMRGGKSLWMVDASKVDLNEIAFTSETMSKQNPAIPVGHMLFSYGARINEQLVQDIQCAVIPVDISASEADEPSWNLVPYVYFPLVTPRQDNPITRNLNLIRFEFASTVDTVGEDPNIKKTVILSSSKNSRYVRTPARVSTDIFSERLEPSKYTRSDMPMAVLLEGRFQSFYKNRINEEFVEGEGVKVLDESVKHTKIIVIGDGDVGKNYVQTEGGQNRVQVLGHDRFSGRTFGNLDFLLNCMNYLLDDEGVMGVRSREVRLRLMDYEQITEHRGKWQLINLLVPVLLVLVFGMIYIFARKRKYARK